MMEPSMKKTKCENESKPNPNWLELPLDLTKNILQRLDSVEILTSARNVCSLWWNIYKDPRMWRTIHIIGINIFLFGYVGSEKIFRSAIDLSCGYLEDIEIQLFGTDDLLKYMAQRASHLRRLQLFYCDQILKMGEIVKNFPLLEELDITCNINLSKDCLEVIGKCCPLLKSLNLGRCLLGYFKFDGEIFAIANTMHQLRHLKLYGMKLNNAVLLSILDGCPLLESLDLKGCICRNLSHSLEKKCHEQIKDLRLPKIVNH